MDEELRELERKVSAGKETSAVLVRPYARAGRFAIEEVEPEQFEPHSKLYNVEGKTVDLYSDRSYTIDSIGGFIALPPRRERKRGGLETEPIPSWFTPSAKTYFSIWKALHDNNGSVFDTPIQYIRETFALEVSRMQIQDRDANPYSDPKRYWMLSDTLLEYNNGSWTCTHYPKHPERKEKTPFEPADDFTPGLCSALFGDADTQRVKTVLEWMTHHKPVVVNETNRYLNVPKTCAFRVEPHRSRFEIHLRDFRTNGASWYVRF